MKKFNFDWSEAGVMHAIVMVLFIAMCVVACLFYHTMTSYDTCCCCSNMQVDAYLEMINGMVGFWMSILAIILMICGIWQYLHIHKVDERIKDIDEQVKDIDDKRKDDKKTFDVMMSEIRIMSEISILLRSIGALNDPIMLLNKNDRQKEVRYYLQMVKDKLERFVDIVQKNIDIFDKSVEYDKDYLDVNFHVILLNLSLCVGRIQVMYMHPRETLAIREFIERNNEIRKAKGSKVKLDDYNDLIRRINELMNVL